MWFKNADKVYTMNHFLYNYSSSTFLHLRLRFALSSLFLLLWFFSLLGLLRRPPRQEVVGDQSCEEVRRHAGVAPEHQAQRLRQHKQQEHVNGRPVIQLHAILLGGAHHSEKIDERHRRVEGQLHHEAEGRPTSTHQRASAWNTRWEVVRKPLKCWAICFSVTLTGTRFLQPPRLKCEGWSDKETYVDFWSVIPAVLSNITHAAASSDASVLGGSVLTPS